MNTRFLDIVKAHIASHPLAETADVYKLLYQAANGPAHLIAHGIELAAIEQEWSRAEMNDEPPFEPISADGLLVRAHFYPLKEVGARFDDIWNALMLTAQGFQPRPELLADWWRDIGAFIQMHELPLSPQQYENLDDEFQQFGFVPMRHSEAFTKAYKPAYAVVLRRLVKIKSYLNICSR